MSEHEAAVEKVKGPYSAIFTPFHANNEVNYEMLARLVEYQISNGIEGIFATGSTGEGLLLTTEERVAVIEQVVQSAAGRVPVVAHVGHPSSEQAARLAVAAADAGADWIASMGPILYGTTFRRHHATLSNHCQGNVIAVHGLRD